MGSALGEAVIIIENEIYNLSSNSGIIYLIKDNRNKTYIINYSAVVSMLLYGCTTWTLNKRMEKKLHGNYTRMLRAVLNKYWRQHPTKQQLYGHLPPITKTIQVTRTRHAGHCWRSEDELISDVLLWTPSHRRAKVEPIYNSSVLIHDIAWKTSRERWVTETCGERSTGRSVFAASDDDDDDDYCN